MPAAQDQPTATPPGRRSVRRLVDRSPEVDRDQIIASLVPPPRFGSARFETYRPDPAEPSQTAAVLAMRAFADSLHRPAGRSSRIGKVFSRRPDQSGLLPGIYLDGGFGVGKTHLLASLWHAAPGPKAYCTFVELTHVAGALGFAATVEALSGRRLLCIDEFELDDPGDTMLVTSLVTALVDAGVRLAATSNTLPDRLGEGRFAAEDFLREIQTLSSRFATVRIDGPDYRHRDQDAAPAPVPDADLAGILALHADSTFDDFTELLAFIGTLHPSRYGRLVQDVSVAGLARVRTVDDHAVALRLVVLVDRLYDRDVPLVTSGLPLDEVFAPELLRSGYRKKYLRALSRLLALGRSGADLAN